MVWSRSQDLASIWHLGKMQFRRGGDEVTHPGGWVVGVDGVASGHVEDGLDDDLVVADPVADLGEGDGAELLDLTGGEGAGFEVADRRGRTP